MSDNSEPARLKRYAEVQLEAIDELCTRIELEATEVKDFLSLSVVNRIRDQLYILHTEIDDYFYEQTKDPL